MGLLRFLQACSRVHETQVADEIARRAPRMLLPFEQYESLPELRSDQRPGRRNLLRWESAKAAWIAAFWEQREMRPSQPQMRFLDETRNGLMLSMYAAAAGFSSSWSGTQWTRRSS